MLKGNTRHHRKGDVVVHSAEPTEGALMRVASYLVDGRVRLTYLDPEKQKAYGRPYESELVLDLDCLYRPHVFGIVVPEPTGEASWSEAYAN